ERARLARVFGHGPQNPVGTVLPLRRAWAEGARRWQSGRWHLRGGPLFLLPGDAPIGYRLPLTALPWADPATIETEPEADPFAPRRALPPWSALRTAHRAGRTALPLAEQTADLADPA
ncbi:MULTISPECIES: transglutaminase family protein, partial [Streptomyces]